MHHVLVIGPQAESLFVSNAAKTVRKYGVKATEILAPRASADMPPHECVINAFEHIADEIEQAGQQTDRPFGLRHFIAIVELSDDLTRNLNELNPISAQKWAATVAMLVLAFPEIHWCFNTPFEPPTSLLYKEAHTMTSETMEESIERLVGFSEQNFTPLFDPTGLRSAIRARVRNQEERVVNNGVKEVRSVAPYVPVRPKLAAVLDEEEDYAYLNAYIAYRFGFRAHVLTTFKMSQRVLCNGATAEHSPQPANSSASGAEFAHENNISLAVEDLYLNYPDKDPTLRLSFSSLLQRDGLFDKLPRAEYRIFHTVGHQHSGQDRINWAENRAYLTGLYRKGTYCKMVYKPGSGIFDIWNRSGLLQRLSKHGGQAAGYIWPPEKSNLGEVPGGHSAPGRLLVISIRLVRRARRILSTAISVPDAIYGAMLALEAQEYLGHRTPTCSLEALALKHQSEVLAECMFYGVEYNMHVKERLKEIKHEVAAIGEWFQPRTRRSSTLNAELRIVSEIMKIFRAHTQFDEEQETLVRIRELHRKLWFMRHKSWAWALYPVRVYIEFLLNSVPRFVIAILLWIGGLTLVYGLLRDAPPDPPEVGWNGAMHGLSDAITTFLGMQPPHNFDELVSVHRILIFGIHLPGHVAAGITALAIIASFVHLGIFISHLYSTIARK